MGEGWKRATEEERQWESLSSGSGGNNFKFDNLKLKKSPGTTAERIRRQLNRAKSKTVEKTGAAHVWQPETAKKFRLARASQLTGPLAEGN